MMSAAASYRPLRDAIDAGNLDLVRAAARSVTVTLEDALRICVIIALQEPHNYDRAAVRWIGRLCEEVATLTLEELDHIQGALAQMPSDSAGALELLQSIGVPGAAAAARARWPRRQASGTA